MLTHADKSKTRTIEELLRNYLAYKTGVVNLKQRIKCMYSPNITSSYKLREGSTGTFNVHSTTEATALDCLESPELQRIHKTIHRYEMIISTINHALEHLPEDQRQFVELRYFQNFSLTKISNELMFSVRQLSRIRNRVLNYLLIALSHLVIDLNNA